MTEQEENQKTAEPIEVSLEEDRHDRTLRHFGKDNFARLQGSNILVVGAGAIGNEFVKNLALLGVREIRLVDFDIVSASNVNRCVFFRVRDAEERRPKVEVVKERVEEMSETSVLTYNMRIEEAPEEVWEDLDMIVVGVDNDYTRMLINAKAVTLTMEDRIVPVVNGAMGLTFVECEVLIPGVTACLTCLWTEQYKESLIKTHVAKSCDEYFVEVVPKFPAISTFTSVVSAIMAAEAIKLLTLPDTESRKDFVGIGYLIRHDLDKYEYTKGPVMRNMRCTETFCRATFDKNTYKALWAREKDKTSPTAS